MNIKRQKNNVLFYLFIILLVYLSIPCIKDFSDFHQEYNKIIELNANLKNKSNLEYLKNSWGGEVFSNHSPPFIIYTQVPKKDCVQLIDLTYPLFKSVYINDKQVFDPDFFDNSHLCLNKSNQFIFIGK